jgi:hypothetical protein
LPRSQSRGRGGVSEFVHLLSCFRDGLPLYASVVQGLRPGGVLVLEAYTPEQIGRSTGGPKDPDMLPTLAELTEELAGLEFVHARGIEREVGEGAYHTGLASVVQIIGLRSPAEHVTATPTAGT